MLKQVQIGTPLLMVVIILIVVSHPSMAINGMESLGVTIMHLIGDVYEIARALVSPLLR